MPSLTLVMAILGMMTAVAEAKPLTDAVSGALTFESRPGMIDVSGQQNLSPRFGLLAGYIREDYQSDFYSGWKFASNFLLFRILSENWQSSSVLSLGLSGVKGPVHDHSAVWGRLSTDWESRKVLVGLSGDAQRGNRMPSIDELQFRLGYSPIAPEMNTVQPWFLLSRLSRSGTGGAKVFTILRLVSGNWWLELGSSLSSQDRILSFSIAL